MEVFLLGQFRASHKGEPITELNHARLQELLAFIMLQKEKPVSKQQLAYEFWPDSSEEQARTNLRNLIFRLKKALPDSEPFIIVDEMNIQWNFEIPTKLDVFEFEQCITLAESLPSIEKMVALSTAANLYTGDLLPGCYSDWLLSERERYHQKYLVVLAELATSYENSGEYERAVQAVEDLLRIDPLNENTCAWLMNLHEKRNNRAQALHVYHRCAEILRRELGVEPGPHLQTLYRKLLQTASLRIPNAPTSSLIGRAQEWQTLTQCWINFTRNENKASSVLILGECGIGKTHLANSYVDWLKRQEVKVITVTCYESSETLSFAMTSAFFRRIFEQDRKVLENLPSTSKIEIARFLPDLFPQIYPQKEASQFPEKWQLLYFYEASSRVVQSLSNPVALFIDDIQWCDQESLVWLDYLLTRQDNKKIQIIATARTEALGEDHPALKSHARFKENYIIELKPLNKIETTMLVEHLAVSIPGTNPDGQIAFDENFCQFIFEQSEGNPLFATEIIRAGIGKDHQYTPYPMDSTPPEKVRALIDWRLNRLTPSTRQVLELSAVIGRSFSYDLLRISSRFDEQSLVNALDECWRLRILREKSGGTYDFSHDLLRKVVYGKLSPSRRSMWHGLVAKALEHIYSGSDDQIAEQIGDHFERAGQPGRASRYFELAARNAARLYSLRQARALYLHTMDLMDKEITPEPILAKILEETGHLELILGNYPDARKHFAAAARRTPAHETAARARILRRISQSWSAQQRYELADNTLITAGRQILASLPAKFASVSGKENTALLCEWVNIQLELADTVNELNQPARLKELLDTLLPALQQVGTTEQFSIYYTLLAKLNNRLQRYRITPETFDAIQRALLLSNLSKDPVAISARRLDLGQILLLSGELQAAIDTLQQVLLKTEEIGMAYFENQAISYLCIAHRLQGNQDIVGSLSLRGLALAEAGHHPAQRGAALANLAWFAYHTGSLDKAESLAKSALEQWQFPGNYPAKWLADFPLAAIALTRGNLAAAYEHLAAIMKPSQQRLPDDLEAQLASAIRQPLNEAGLRQALNTASQFGYL